MGSIELKLNITKIDLIIAIGVVSIAILLSIGFILWLIKTSKQNKALKSIDTKLGRKEDELIKALEDKQDNTTHTLREYVYIDKGGEKRKIEKIEVTKDTENQKETPCQEIEIKELKNNDVEEDDEPEVDVMAEITKMLKETESYKMQIPKLDRTTIGKSGTVYTKEDIENIIKD